MMCSIDADAPCTAIKAIAVERTIMSAAHYQLTLAVLKYVIDIFITRTFIADNFGLSVAIDKLIITHKGIRILSTQQNRILSYLYTFAAIKNFPVYLVFIFK